MPVPNFPPVYIWDEATVSWVEVLEADEVVTPSPALDAISGGLPNVID
jgi:hypothetical protein